MSRALIALFSKAKREQAARWCMNAPVGTRIEFKRPSRTIPQNDRMWAMLTDIAGQLTWHGQKYVPDDWKDFLMHQYRAGRWMPAEEGGMVPIGMRTSDLSKDEMSDLIEVIFAFGARHGVTFKDDADHQPGTGAVVVAAPELAE